MESNPRCLVSIIIVTIGAKDYLWRCLDSIKTQSYSCLETIVIDNSLDAGFSAKISQLFPSIKLCSNVQNLHYGVSLNRGISQSQGEFILCLNDDVILDKKFIQESLRGFWIKNNIGLVSGKILRANRETLDSTGLFLSVWRTARERGYGRRDVGQFEKEGYVFGVSGSAAFYRKKMLEEIKDRDGYFDPNFCMFYEDLDISWRAQKSGWAAYYVPGAIAYHVRGGSFRPDSGIGKSIARKYLNDQLHYDLIKNRYLTILKNETFFSFFVHLIPILIYDLCVWSYVVFFRPKVVKLFFSRFFAKLNKKTLRKRFFKKRF